MDSIKLIENLRPDIVGGQYLVYMRAIFDHQDKNIIVASNRQVYQYDVKSCEQVSRINVNLEGSDSEARIVACERVDNTLYIISSCGKIFIWNLETQDWTNELTLPLEDDEILVSCKILSKRQYIYSIKKHASDKVILYISMSRSERERPKHRDEIGECTSGDQNSFDLGCMVAAEDLDQETVKNDKLAKQRCLAYIHDSSVYFQKVAIGEKFTENKHKQLIKDLKFTCIRANTKRPMVAAGDALGRIYLYQGDFNGDKFNRTKLHWHTLPVSDMCFSSTGNTLFSVGGESGCVVIWDLTQNNLGKKRVVARLGMPIRFINCGNLLNQLVISFEDNEIQFMDTNNQTMKLKTFTRRTLDMYKENDYRALRLERELVSKDRDKSIGLLWHSTTDSVVTNAKTGWLQFYSPKEKTRVLTLNLLKSDILSLEKEARVIPSDITKATLTVDGNWLAFYETRDSEDLFPSVKLHIWQRSGAKNRWSWIQTADRLHSSTSIADLKFSSDGQYLVSVSEDGTFHVLHRICLDSKIETNSCSKQMYAKGFIGNVPENLPAMATFSQDSSVLAMSLKNNTTLIWMIVEPYKLVYECQLNQIIPNQSNGENGHSSKPSHDVLGLHFGYHKPSESLAPLCEVRSNSIRIWNILNPQETMEYTPNELTETNVGEFTAAAFDQCPGSDKSLDDHFAVSTKWGLIFIFKLQIARTSRILRPIIVVNCRLQFTLNGIHPYYTHMCFLNNPIIDIDEQCYHDPRIVKLLNRLCLMTNYQELVGITDKLTVERQSASNNCNRVNSFDMSDLQAYFMKNAVAYDEETRNLPSSDKIDSRTITRKQRKIRNRLEVQKMLKDLLIRVPSHSLPNMTTLGPMILDKLI